MKRRISILLCVLLFCMTSCSRPFDSSDADKEKTHLSREEQLVDNRTNNLVANEVALADMINDNIYFAVYYDEDDMDLFELSSGNSKKVFSKAINNKIYDASYKPFLTLNYVLDGRILRSADSDTYVDIKRGTMIESSNVYTPDDHYDFDAYIYDNQRYFMGTNKVYRYLDGEYELVFSNDNEAEVYNLKPENFYIKDDDFFVEMHSGRGQFIVHYSFAEKKILNEIKIAPNNYGEFTGVNNIIADGNDLYYVKKGIIYHANISTGKAETLFKTDNGIVSFNYFDGVLYVNSFDLYNVTGKNGLYAIDTLNHNKVTELVKQSIGGIYIFDNVSFYYDTYDQDDNYTLYRYNIFTNDIETVFSVK